MQDFRLTYHFNSRADFVAFGQKLGQAMKSNDREQSWFIRLDGDFNGGKSLIALAVDKGFRPEAYPGGLHRGIRISTLMPESAHQRHTIFKHFGHAIHPSKESFDSELQYFAERNPMAHVLIASNILRNAMITNDLEGGLDSDKLDLAVRVTTCDGDFVRDVELIVKNPALLVAIPA